MLLSSLLLLPKTETNKEYHPSNKILNLKTAEEITAFLTSGMEQSMHIYNICISHKTNTKDHTKRQNSTWKNEKRK